MSEAASKPKKSGKLFKFISISVAVLGLLVVAGAGVYLLWGDQLLSSLLEDRGVEIISGSDLDDAEFACGKALALDPAEPLNHYNMAMFRMLSGDPNGALAALEKDVQLGDDEVEESLREEIFAPLRDGPRFRALVERMRKAATSP